MDNMEMYEETAREDFPAGEMELPVAQVTEEETNRLLPEEIVAEEENYLVIVFNKPYNFEGEIFSKLDLSGLEELKSRNLTAIEKAYGKTGVISSMPETTFTYAKITAAAVTGLPAEFFDGLPGKEMGKIKTAVTHFFYSED